MNDKVKKMPSPLQDGLSEVPAVALTAELKKALINFQQSPLAAEHLGKTYAKLQNMSEGVLFPYARLLEELQVSNRVYALIGGKAAVLAANDDDSFELAA